MPELDERAYPREKTEENTTDWRLYERQYYTAFTCYGSFEEFKTAILNFRARLSPEQRSAVQDWIAIGRRNPWISQADDPPFNELSFHICRDFRELADRLLHGNWCLGQAFTLENLCFINQVNGGDEWLTIRGATAFESITMKTRNETQEDAEARLAETIERIRRATDEQLLRLEY